MKDDLSTQQLVHLGWSSSQSFFRTPVRYVDESLSGIQIITVSGIYQLTVLLPISPGNLIATVYSDSQFIRPVRSELRNVDFSCADRASYPVIGNDAFSLRWSGLFRPTKSGVCVMSHEALTLMLQSTSKSQNLLGTHFKDICTPA